MSVSLTSIERIFESHITFHVLMIKVTDANDVLERASKLGIRNYNYNTIFSMNGKCVVLCLRPKRANITLLFDARATPVRARSLFKTRPTCHSGDYQYRRHARRTCTCMFPPLLQQPAVSQSRLPSSVPNSPNSGQYFTIQNQ
jgi:hypothetical protein